MTRKVWIGVAVIAAIVAALVAVFVANYPKNEVPIGAILPLTGDGAKYGEEAQRAIELAVAEVNSAGGIGGRNVVVIYEDDQGMAKNAVAALKKLSSVDKVPVAIGPMYSSTALAAAPVAEAEKVVLFSPSASSPEYTDAGDYAFRNWPSDVYEGGEMAEFAFDQIGLRRVGILTVSLDYGIGLASVFTRTFEEFGGQVPIQEKYVQGATDFRTQLTKLKGANLDAIYLPGYYNEVAVILKQARELDLQVRCLSCVGFDNPKSLEIAGNAAEGVVFARPAYDTRSSDPRVVEFVQAFERAHGIEPGTYAAHAYDAAHIILQVMSQGAANASDIKAALYEVRDFPGVSGNTSFDKHGDVVKPILIMSVRNGEFEPHASGR